MKANKRVRDPRRIGKSHLSFVSKDGVRKGTTTFPTKENGIQRLRIDGSGRFA